MASAQTQPTTQPAKRRGGFGRILARVLVGLLVALVIISLAGAAFGVWFVQRTQPQTSGTLQVNGLHGTVSVLRDTWGVPHITGNDIHDVVFAQGYVTAQDRLFQLEFNRRVAQGRLAEMFGAGGNDRPLVDADVFLRTLGLYTAAQTELSKLDDTTRDELQAYADGINAFVASHRDSLPLEFSVLGVTPEPWSPVDSLAYGRVVAYTLDGTWNTKYARAIVTAKTSSDAARTLFPAYPSDNPTLISTPTSGFASARGEVTRQASEPAQTGAPDAAEIHAFAHLRPTLLHGADVVRGLLGDIHDGLGSNNWVVDGTKSATGKPLLANDPHLGIRMPAIWYEIGLRGGGLDVIGFSFPGDPGVVIGHNNYIAWGVTNVDADNTDLYLEKLDPTGHPGMYQFDREWRPLETRQEVIKVRGEATPVNITVSSTLHGPILTDAVNDLKRHPEIAPVALKWTALQPDYTLAGFFQLDFARNWNEFDAAIANISISQNFVFADVDGNIGYRMSGLLPIRPVENETLPVAGSTSAHEWNGYVAQSAMPRVYNPANHMIVTANNQIVDQNYNHYVTTDWDYGYRARRITDLLNAASTISVTDYQRIQADVLSIPASKLTPKFIAAGPGATGDAAVAAKILTGWDYTMTRDSAAAAVYEATAGALARATIEQALGKDVYAVYRGNLSASGVFTVLINLLDQPSAPFITSSPNDEIVKALTDAMAELRGALGSDTSKWRWGALHQAHFAHPLASVSPLNVLFDVAPLDRPGDSVTVNAAGGGCFSADTSDESCKDRYGQHTVPSMRQIIDLSNFDNSLWVTTTGESGEPGSAHYSDLVPLWDQNKYQPMYFTPARQASTATGILTIKP
jgi:penicillin amidase